MQALAGLVRGGARVHEDDVTIRKNVCAELNKLPWAANEFVNVTVKDGVVDLWGSFTAYRQDEAAVVAAENTPGVKEVKNHLAWVDPLSGLVVYDARRAAVLHSVASRALSPNRREAHPGR